MAFMAKTRAQAHYNAGTRILVNTPSRQKDFAQAVKHLQKAVKLDPGFADAFHNLAHVWYQLAEYNIAVTAIQGVRLNPQYAEDSIGAALESALDAVDRALEIRYEFPQAHNTRAMVLAKLFRLNEAMEAAELALSQYPDYDNARDNREKIKEMIKERAALPGYKNERSFLEKIKELRKTQSAIWKDLMK